MSHETPADVSCDIAQAFCDVARAVAVRCSDVVRCGAPTRATISRARGDRATSYPPWATSQHRPAPGSEVASSRRPCAMSLAMLLVGRGRAIIRESSMIPPLPPVGAPDAGAMLRHRTGSLRCRSVASGSGAMWRHRTLPERHRIIAPASGAERCCVIAPRPERHR